jgi:hypothetical protein
VVIVHKEFLKPNSGKEISNGWDSPDWNYKLVSQNGTNGAFTLDVKSMLIENLGGILDGTPC